MIGTLLKAVAAARRAWYGGGSPFDEDPKCGGSMLRNYLVEVVGAATRLTDATGGLWFGGGCHRGADGTADGSRYDVKRAWTHRDGVLAFPGPGEAGQFDAADVQEIVLVVTDQDVTTEYTWHNDGGVDLVARIRPDAVYVVPAVAINSLMRRDGRSSARWLLFRDDIETYRVR